MARNFNMSRVVRVDLDLINLGASTFNPEPPPEPPAPDDEGYMLVKSAEIDDPGGSSMIDSISVSGLSALEDGYYIARLYVELATYNTSTIDVFWYVNDDTTTGKYAGTPQVFDDMRDKPMYAELYIAKFDGLISLNVSSSNWAYLSDTGASYHAFDDSEPNKIEFMFGSSSWFEYAFLNLYKRVLVEEVE